MALNQSIRKSHVTSLNEIASFEPSQSDPSFEIMDRLDNIWCGHMAGFDCAYGENQDLPKQELRRLTMFLQAMEKYCAAVRVEFERRLDV
jgi:hypothetical protein